MAYILLRHRDVPDISNLNVYKNNGGCDAFKKVVTKMKPNEVTDTVKASGLRGRGGAGFAMGKKVSFLPKGSMDKYLVCKSG